jgi:hypothetical protein
MPNRAVHDGCAHLPDHIVLRPVRVRAIADAEHPVSPLPCAEYVVRPIATVSSSRKL